MPKPLLLSVGADGRFAGMVAPELVKRAALVRGLIHRAENADKAKSAGATEVVVGDLRDEKSMDRALNGVDGLFYLAPVFQHNEAEMERALLERQRRQVCGALFSHL